jgi:SAM-dependent methyltransferase
MNQTIADSFEQSFLASSLSRQIRACDSYELAPLFLKLFSKSQPVLEAGCGSGRWCGWLQTQGIGVDGVDWSQELCQRAAVEIPKSRFYACDMSDTGLPDGAYGGLMALGSIEHAVQGPQKALTEFYRLLRPDGVAVITVPYGGALRIGCRALAGPLEAAKGVRLLRRLTGKSPLAADSRSLRVARRGTVTAWHPRFSLGREGWSFYEYQFNHRQLNAFIEEAGFTVVDRFTAFRDEGLWHTFGRLAGRWNNQEFRVELNALGRFLRRVLPPSLIGHMLCYVVAKPAGNVEIASVGEN